MYCTKCGNEVNDGARFCTKCGANLNVGNQPNFNYNNNNNYCNNVNVDPKDGFGFAVVTLILSLILPFVGFIMALVLRNNYRSKETNGLLKAALIISSIELGVCVFFIILYVILLSTLSMTYTTCLWMLV